jgi:glycerol uptake facilitator protein
MCAMAESTSRPRAENQAPPGRAARRANPFARLRGTTAGEMTAEMLGTFVILLFGDGSVAMCVAALPESGRATLVFSPADWVLIIFGWCFGVVFGVYVAGGVSGAHLNPAVTLSFALRRRFAWGKVLPYWFAQVLGAFLGAAVVYALYHSSITALLDATHTAQQNSLGTFSIFATFPAHYFHGSWVGPFVDQVVGTAALVGIILAVIDERNTSPSSNMAPFIIGLVVAAIGISIGANAGYAINPARDLGPRLFAFFAGWGKTAIPGTFQWFSDYMWIPIIGPLVGGPLGAYIYDLLIGTQLGQPELTPPGPAVEER